MRKYLLITLCLLTVAVAQAQSRAGLKIAPGLSFNRVDSNADTLRLAPSGAALRFIVGPVLDFSLGSTDNYFTTGILFSSQRVSVESEMTQPEAEAPPREVYNLQYLQFPATFTFLTDEIALDKRIYVEIGAMVGVKLTEKDKYEDQLWINKFNTFNLTAVLAAGLELNMGPSTSFSLGLSYHRGLADVVSSHSTGGSLQIKNDQVSLDFTVHF